MNILLTGGAGYVGSACLRLLKQSGHTVVAFDNLIEGHPLAVDGAKLVVGDIRDTAFLEQTMRDNQIEAVMHFAAATDVGESVRNPSYHYDNNIGGLCHYSTLWQQPGLKRSCFPAPVPPMA